MPNQGATDGSAIGLWLALAAMLTFATSVLLSARASRKLDSDSGALLAAAVTLPLGLLIALLQFAAGRELARPTPVGLIAFALAGIFSTYLGRWLFFKSVETIGPTRAATFQTCSPVFAAFIGWLWLGERLDGISLLGMGLAVAGLLVMSQARRDSGTAGSAVRRLESRAALAALAIGIGSSCAYAISQVLRGAAVRQWDEPVIGATLGALAGVTVLLLVSGRRTGVAAANIRRQPISALLFCAAGSLQFMGQVLMIISMKTIPVSVAALIACCTPLVVLPMSMLLLKNAEQVKAATVMGVFATVVGVGIVIVVGGLH